MCQDSLACLGAPERTSPGACGEAHYYQYCRIRVVTEKLRSCYFGTPTVTVPGVTPAGGASDVCGQPGWDEELRPRARTAGASVRRRGRIHDHDP